MAGVSAESRVRSGGHAYAIGWGHNIDPGNGIPVLSSNLVETSIVNAEAKASTFLLHEEYQYTCGGL